MSKVKPVNDMVIVVPLDKIDKDKSANPFSNFVVSNNLGTIKYTSRFEENFSNGTKVYFGSRYERLIMEGVEVLAMDVDNIIAYVED